ncbi:hypothetical protein DICSQDRAFT_37136, partial [Dichomitus squalens LYAD-421 SS1]
ICREVEQECFLETRKKITLPKSTVSARANGRTSIQDFNATKRWLTPAEEDVVVEFAIDAGLRGFPLTHRMLKDHVDAICRAKLPDSFPKDGVGKEWTQRFMDRHSDAL